MKKIAVIDTETNWADQVMSIGTVIASPETFGALGAKYHILVPEIEIGGMYSGALEDGRLKPVYCTRAQAMEELRDWLKGNGVEAIFAYNAAFDFNHLPELREFAWYDIMRLAAYRQFNPHIPPEADCCSTGRLRRGYGVEAMLRLLSGDRGYHETHNALYDAVDELAIMRLLGHGVEDYLPLGRR